LTGERRAIVNKIGGILATLGVKGYRVLKGDRREQLALLRQPDWRPRSTSARIRIERLLDRLNSSCGRSGKWRRRVMRFWKKPAPATRRTHDFAHL